MYGVLYVLDLATHSGQQSFIQSARIIISIILLLLLLLLLFTSTCLLSACLYKYVQYKYPSNWTTKTSDQITQNFPSKTTRTGKKSTVLSFSSLSLSLSLRFSSFSLSFSFFLTISSFIGIVFFLPFFFFFFLLHYQTGPALFTPSPTHLLSLSYSLPHVSLFSCLSLLFSLLHSLYLYYRSTQLSLSLSSSSSRSIPTD